MTKRTLMYKKKINCVTIYNFVIKASSMVVFGINILADITFM